MIKHLSFSSLTLFDNCPEAWVDKYVRKNKKQAGTAAAIGSAFGQRVVEKIEVPLDKEAPKHASAKVILNPEAEEQVNKLLDVYFGSEFSWKHADIAEKKVSISPEEFVKWCKYYDIPCKKKDFFVPFEGYIDLFRENPLAQLIDLKTAGQKGVKLGWLRQLAIYSLKTESTQSDIHCVVKTKVPKFYVYRLPIEPETFKWVLIWILDLYKRIKVVLEKGGPVVSTPDYYCNWCTKTENCDAFYIFNRGEINDV